LRPKLGHVDRAPSLANDGSTVQVTDASSNTQSAPLFFASAGQINFEMPPGLAAGNATVTVTASDGTTGLQEVTVGPWLPDYLR
jgi:uncharacterized protein (TIGR03437 family)